jgi:hypothetical protein
MDIVSTAVRIFGICQECGVFFEFGFGATVRVAKGFGGASEAFWKITVAS